MNFPLEIEVPNSFPIITRCTIGYRDPQHLTADQSAQQRGTNHNPSQDVVSKSIISILVKSWHTSGRRNARG
jgi:hypothetical protein